MGLIYLLDTNVISDLYKESTSVVYKSKVNTYESLCAISSITWDELVYGLELMPEGKKKKFLENYLYGLIHERFPVIPFDDSAASIHAKIRAELRKKGTPRPFADTQIAATAIAGGMILITHNVKDYEGIPGVNVEDWI